MAGNGTITLEELVPFSYGKALPERERNPRGSIPVYGSNGIVGYHDKPLTGGPTIIVGRKGTVGALHFSAVCCWPIDTTFFYSSSDESLVRYRYYALKILGLEHMNADSAVPGLNRDAAHALVLRNFSDKEQRVIAHVLGTLDDKIELNRDMDETLESMAQTIFKSWFLDFDPVRAKVNGEPSDSICRRLGLTPDLLALFPSRFSDSEVGLIPEGWQIRDVASVAMNIFSGGTPDTRHSEYWNGDLNWFSSGETRNHFVVNTEKTITQAAIANSSTKLALPGDILIASAGQGNTRGQTSYCAIQTYINQSVIDVRSNSDLVHPAWLFYNLSGRYNEMRSLSDSHSSRGSLTTKLIGSMSIVYCGSHLVREFGKLVSPLINRQIENRREIEVISEMRDAVLPKLLSGELNVMVAGEI